MILFLLCFGSLIMVMLYYYEPLEKCALWISGKSAYWSVVLFFGTILYGYFRQKRVNVMKQFHTQPSSVNINTYTNVQPNHYSRTRAGTTSFTSTKNITNTTNTTRNVSNLTKKIIASNQGWHCGHCHTQLDFTYEIDHIIPLFRGGSNESRNLIALCRNCHGKKTIMERIKK
jgi:5-methylcytosine-specific restriction endonuclease McrA